MTVTHVVPKTIPTSGDQTVALNSWIASIQNGTAVKPVDVSFARKQFQVEGTLTVAGKKYLRFRDGGTYATTIGYSHRAHWRVVGGTGLRWLNIKVVGPRQPFSLFDSTNQWQHGFDFQGVDGYNLGAVTVQGVLGDGVCNELNPMTKTWTQNGIITGTCKFLGTGRMTVSFTAAKNIQVAAIKVTDPTLTIFDIEPNGAGWGAENITVDGARIADTNPAHTFTLLYVADFGGAGSVVSDITVRNTVQQGNSVVVVAKPPVGDRYQRVTVTDNRSNVEQSAYIDVSGIDGLTLSGNTVPSSDVNTNDCVMA